MDILEALEVNKRGVDLALAAGQQKRTREILSWAKRHRKHIRRDELISYLTGKSTPSRSHHR